MLKFVLVAPKSGWVDCERDALRGLSKQGCLRTVMSCLHIACLILMAMIYGDDDNIFDDDLLVCIGTYSVI